VSQWWVKRRLTFWGRWARSGVAPSLPTMSTTEKARIGRGGVPDDSMPPDIAEVDHVVCIAPPEVRQVLIVYYAQTGSKVEKARRVGITRYAFGRRLERGESFVALNL
jgi:hypothetical protein